jgi:hypothetical protein
MTLEDGREVVARIYENAGYIVAHGIKVGDVIRVVPLASQ